MAKLDHVFFDASRASLSGRDALPMRVKVTIGPRGRNVVIEKKVPVLPDHRQ